MDLRENVCSMDVSLVRTLPILPEPPRLLWAGAPGVRTGAGLSSTWVCSCRVTNQTTRARYGAISSRVMAFFAAMALASSPRRPLFAAIRSASTATCCAFSEFSTARL